MLYPQNGIIAMGSRRTTPTLPVIAAVVSVLIAEPRKTPCDQSKASKTSGMTPVRREPKMTPEFGCAAGPSPGFHGRPCQSVSPPGGAGLRPSHHGSPDAVMATLVKIVFERTMDVALGFVFGLVLGATPKKPRSGFTARS